MILPKKVKESLDKIHEERGRYVYAKPFGDHYYVIEYEGKWDSQKKKVRMKTRYLGKIDNDGTFIEARKRSRKQDGEGIPDKVAEELQKLKTGHGELRLIQDKGKYYLYEIGNSIPHLIGYIDLDGHFVKQDAETDRNEIKNESHLDKMDLRLLMLLSVNARSTVQSMARDIGLSSSATRHRIEKLQKRYNIKYTLEFGYSFFGFFRFVVLIKFKDAKPSSEAIKKVLEKEPSIQYAALLKGPYDLFIYMLAENTRMLEINLYRLESDPVFAPFPSYRYVSYITYSYGYIPMRDAFFEVLKDKVWHRSKESPRRAPEKILNSDYLVLKELNENGNIDFADIDRKYSLGRGAAQYTYHRLLERKIIYRITITMQNLPTKYAMIVKANQLDMKEFNDNRGLYLSDIVDDTETPVNKYLLVGDVAFPRGLFFIMPIFNDGDAEATEKRVHAIVRGSEIESAITTETLVGNLGFRKFNNELSKQSNLIPIYKKGLKTITTSEEDY